MRVPGSGLTHKVKSCLVRDRRLRCLRVRSEEDRCTEDPLKGGDQPPILRSSLLHPEHIQHFSRTAERDGLFLLPHRERGQENGYQAILSPGNTAVRMPDHLQNELPFRRSCITAPLGVA